MILEALGILSGGAILTTWIIMHYKNLMHKRDTEAVFPPEKPQPSPPKSLLPWELAMEALDNERNWLAEQVNILPPDFSSERANLFARIAEISKQMTELCVDQELNKELQDVRPQSQE